MNNNTVYAEMDVHKESFALCSYTIEAEKASHHQKTETDYKKILKYLEHLRTIYVGDANFIYGYEAGFIGYTLYHQLEKTYIANALCIIALHQQRTIKYIRANTLLQESEKARLASQSYDYINHLASFILLVIDDFGLMELDMDKCRNLLEVIKTRDCKKPTPIVSQLPLIKWCDLLKYNTYTDACLSRMTSKAYRLECDGRDMRKSS